MKLRFLAILGALALTTPAAAVPAAAAGATTGPDQPVTASVLTPMELGVGAPAQEGGAGYSSSGGDMGMGSGQSMSSDWFRSSDDDDGGHMRHHRRWWGGGFGLWGGPTGSPWPWWAGRPLWQISAMTGGTWPWAFGPPLFLPPPVPPVPPLGTGLFAASLLQQSGRTCTPTLAFIICR